MPTIIKAPTGADFLALVPHLLGYQPECSLVIVAFRGKRTCGALRFDLPGPLPLAEQRRLATRMIGTLCRIPDVDALVPVVYTDDAIGEAPWPYGELLDVLCHRAEVGGMSVRGAFCVGSDAWVVPLAPDAQPEPLEKIANSALTALAEREGHPHRNGITDGLALPKVGQFMAERVARRLRTVDVSATPDPFARLGAVGLVHGLEGLLAREPGSLTAEERALLGALSATPWLRDVALLAWAFGRDVGASAHRFQVAYSNGDDSDPEGVGMLLAGQGARPDPDRIERALALLAEVAASLPRSRRTGALAMLGWLNWALGGSSRAAVFVDEALEIDPQHGLSGLIGAMIAGGHLPDWAFEVPPMDESEVRYAELPSVSAR